MTTSPGGDRPVSVIIPTLNEERGIAGCLEAALAGCPGSEVIVVDGGSEDSTCEAVASFEPRGVRLIRSQRGRGRQMNAGAAGAAGGVLVFLHADAILPRGALECIRESLADPSVVAGAFTIRTVADSGDPGRHPLLALADLRSRYTRRPYGDQTLFVRREAFRALGGYAEIPLMEDLEFVGRLRKLGRISRVPSPVTVSGRRFRQRPIRAALAMNLFPLLYSLGFSPWLLERLYGHPR